MKIKNVLLVTVSLIAGFLLSDPSKVAAESVKTIIVENFPPLQNVQVMNFPESQKVETKQDLQLWDYWYQCHPNPTNENDIRGYLNDRGKEGWEVVAAAGSGNLICEYYKRPKSQ